MNISSTHFLLSIELGFLFFLGLRTNRLTGDQGNNASIYFYLLWLTGYAILSGILGAKGVYVSDYLLQGLPGLWLQLVTVLAIVLPVVMLPGLRNSLRRIVDGTPWHWFAYFHALRVAALGTAYKTIIGQFPISFEIAVGLPDLLFGISAFWIARKARCGKIDERGFMIWNLVGFLVIVPAAPIVLQLGLPGPLQVFTSLPDARAVFTYPMSVASMMGVPLLVLVNLAVAWRLWERRKKPLTR